MRRHLRSVFLLVTVVMALLAPLGVEAQGEGTEGGAGAIVSAVPHFGGPATVRSRWGLRLRSGPRLYDPILFVLYNGETVYPGAGPVWGSGIAWMYVRVYRGGTYYEGFCAADYLSTYVPDSPAPIHGSKVTSPDGLRFRSGPGLGYAILAIGRYGTIVQPTGNTQWADGYSWAEIVYNGRYYWAASAYLTSV